MNPFFFHHPAQIRPGRSRRASSWDRTGGNDDCWRIDPGKTAILAEIDGPGSINHIYFTTIDPNLLDYRDAVLRMYWDGEETPSVEAPWGDFFCISNCTVRRFQSLMMAVNPGAGPHTINNGLNCYLPMPFAGGARIELANQSNRVFGGTLGRVWFHIDYETFDSRPPDDYGRFHAQWRRKNLTTPAQAPSIPNRGAFPAANLTGADNYVILEAAGEGHLAGVFLQVDNVHGGWYGEGDDMIFIDGERWPPSLHGTGTEEIFGGGACPDKEYAGPYTGFVLIENEGGEAFKGKNAMYRWYVHDPVRFGKSIRVTVEHGHANDLANDYSSVAYWYQREPHAPFPALPPVRARRPLMPQTFYVAQAKFAALTTRLIDYQDRFVFNKEEPPVWLEGVKRLTGEGYLFLYTKEYDKANERFAEAIGVFQANGQDVAVEEP